MASNLAGFTRKARSDSIFDDLGFYCLCGRRPCMVDFLGDKVFAKGGKRMGSAAGHDNPWWSQADEANGIAEDVRPQPGASGQRDRIVHADLGVTDPAPGRSATCQFLEWDELKENAIVDDQAQSI